MRAIVVGCGRVGSAVAQALDGAGWEVAVIDENEEALTRLGKNWRHDFVVGHGMDASVLERAGIDGADALVAATDGDNTNLVVAQVATKRYGVESVAARILDPGRADFYAGKGFDIVSPTRSAIEGLTRWASALKEPA